jgi:hypothetical protein
MSNVEQVPPLEFRRGTECPLEMNAAAFLVALRRRARVTSPARDPLAEATRFFDAHGETGEGQALRRVIDTLASGNGEFAESEVWLFSAETLPLVAALVDSRIEGRYPELEWRDK